MGIDGSDYHRTPDSPPEPGHRPPVPWLRVPPVSADELRASFTRSNSATDKRVHMRPPADRRGAPADFAPAPVTMPEARSLTDDILAATTDKLLEAAMWEGLRHVVTALQPGAGGAVEIAYRATKVLSAIDGVLKGEGFVFQIGVADLDTEHTGVGLALRFREAGDDPGGLPRVGIALDVNRLEPLAPGDADVDGRAESPHRLDVPAELRWRGDWTTLYGMDGVRRPSEVLARVRLWRAPAAM